jgi:hypothetical protein
VIPGVTVLKHKLQYTVQTVQSGYGRHRIVAYGEHL